MTKLLILLLGIAVFSRGTNAADQPQWGQAWSRNMVSVERNLPSSFDPKTGANIRWSVAIGTESYATPIVAGGRVYLGTNNENPRDPAHTTDSGVMMCFDELTGKFLWQLVVPKREEDPYLDWPKTGMASPVTVEGDRVYLVSNRGEVMCLDARGMTNGNDAPFRDEAAHMMPRPTNGVAGPTPAPAGDKDADIIWLFDMVRDAGIWTHDGAHSSIMIQGDYLYLNTGTGVDNTHKRIRTPDAPSLIVLDKRTGRLLAREDEHIAPNIFHAAWCSPSLGEVNGRPLLFFGGGNGMIYAFETLANTEGNAKDSGFPDGVRKLEKVWQLDFDPAAPKEDIHRYSTNRRESPSDCYGMPVFDHGKIYIAAGGDLWWGKTQAWLKCIDPSKTGDITTNGVIWTYPLEKHVLSTAAVYDGLVFIADCGRKFHCVDAETGKPCWTQDIDGEVWASPMVADGKVYLGTRSGQFWVFAATRKKNVLSTVEFGAPITSTVTAANGALYVATMNRLYAIGKSLLNSN